MTIRVKGIAATITAAALIAFSCARAEVTRLEITSKRPYGTFRAGEYVMWEGKLHGDLAPQEQIPGLDKVKRNGRGRVEYSTRIVLIMPSEPRRGNGTLIVDLPNRGKAYAQALYNSPRAEPFTSGTFEHGVGFLQDNGYSTAEVYWELGQGAELPSFVDTDGRTKYVEGVGFAIFRDAADFLARASADSVGTPNPLKGSVSRVIASGKSQTGRFLKTFLLHGFNMADGRRVFDGMHVFVSGAGLLPILQTGAGPQSSADRGPSFGNPEFRGVHEGPLTIGEIIARVEKRGEVPPKMIMITSTSDYFGLRASLGRTGASGTTDQPLPPNVRMYDIAGAPHAMVPRARKCPLPPSRLDWAPISRAALMRLDAWVAVNTEPPASQLLQLERAGNDPFTLKAPAHLAQAVIQIPRRDADGNALGGVRLPDLVVPLGTHGGENSTAAGCTNIGSWKPFAATKAARETASDKRLSVAERYKSRDDYVNRIRIAANNLMQTGLLLADDAAVIIQAAAASPAFGPGEADPDPR